MTASTSTSAVNLSESNIDELRARITSGDAVYALLDACDEPRIPARMREIGSDRAASLYRGAAERDYWAIAPYVAQLDEQLLSWIMNDLAGSPWGVFVVADVSLPQLRKHFRRFLLVEGPDGRQLYFRFYDPRVLPTFLQTCTPSEAEQFFGPVTGFAICDGPVALMQLTR
ncbi:MAG: DUF4123 domain-containing protein [Planctomycetaceae bacterium]|nr:DUF4123 domain-containing protein [Planctomycetaceae bacterium]